MFLHPKLGDHLRRSRRFDVPTWGPSRRQGGEEGGGYGREAVSLKERGRQLWGRSRRRSRSSRSKNSRIRSRSTHPFQQTETREMREEKAKLEAVYNQLEEEAERPEKMARLAKANRWGSCLCFQNLDFSGIHFVFTLILILNHYIEWIRKIS